MRWRPPGLGLGGVRSAAGPATAAPVVVLHLDAVHLVVLVVMVLLVLMVLMMMMLLLLLVLLLLIGGHLVKYRGCNTNRGSE